MMNDNAKFNSAPPCAEIWGERISAFIDGELDEKMRREVERHVEECPACADFKLTIERLKGITMRMKFASPSDEAWRKYWRGIYNRIERGVGWVLLSVGLIILLCFGLYSILTEFFADPAVPLALKLGVGVFGAGIIILLVSIIREKCFRNKSERYKEVDI